MRIGVYVCHCGNNIASTVDVEEVTRFAQGLPYVVVAKDYLYMCSEPGQRLVRDDIEEFRLDRIVIASCSPTMHGAAFRHNVQRAGVNPYRLERADIREQCSWVHNDKEKATEKAKRLVAAAVARVAYSEPLETKETSVVPAVLVIGAGIAGIRVALDLANAGIKSYVIEKEPDVGGHVVQLGRTFPTLEDVGDALLPTLTEFSNHPNIECITCAEVAEVEGYIGNFRVKVKVTRDSEQKEEELRVGAIILATGYDTFDARLKPEYGYGRYSNVITAMEMERLCSVSGPTGGKIQLNGKKPQNVVFIQCVGSRDKTVGNEYCSRVCCMYTAKQAHLVKEMIPDAKVTVCYIDIRSFGKGHEQFIEQVQKEGVIYRRGNVSEVYRKGDKVVVRAEDTLLGEPYEEEADMVVLATGLVPRRDTKELVDKLRISQSSDGFFLEDHPKLGPVNSRVEGIFLAGCCQGPKDITDTIAQAHAAAGKAGSIFFVGKVEKDPLVCQIDEEICAGCRMCEEICEYEALRFDERRGIMTVNELLCRGCGACCVTCPSGAAECRNTTNKQMLEAITALV